LLRAHELVALAPRLGRVDIHLEYVPRFLLPVTRVARARKQGPGGVSIGFPNFF
jgi:hypothetical protein